MNESNNEPLMITIPKDMEENLNRIREYIRSDVAEYGLYPSLRDIGGEFGMTAEEVAEYILYLPNDEFCDYVPFLKNYEWELVSQMSEMRNQESSVIDFVDDDDDDDDDVDYSLASFHFTTYLSFRKL